MDRKPVQSANIRSVGYNPETQTLEVEFRYQSKVYTYANVPQHKYDELMGARSIGGHLKEYIAGRPDHPHAISHHR